MDLLCAPSIKIGLFGSSFFLGYACTGVLMSFMKSMPRKRLFIIGQTIEVFAGLILTLGNTYELKVLGYFLQGLFMFGY